MIITVNVHLNEVPSHVDARFRYFNFAKSMQLTKNFGKWLTLLHLAIWEGQLTSFLVTALS